LVRELDRGKLGYFSSVSLKNSSSLGLGVLTNREDLSDVFLIELT
jgi:hypothetical protein